jgi:hypothetical protein
MRFVYVLLFSLSTLFARGQVTISVHLPQAGLVQKNQLWNLMLFNSGSSTVQISLALTLRDIRTGQSMVSGTSSIFSLPKGVKQVSPSDLGVIQYTSLQGSASNYLPLGNYIACYRVTKFNNDQTDPIAEECVNVSIMPLSPPLLVTPADRSILRTSVPQFTWAPPTPATMFSDLRYELSICEVGESQSPSEALLYNTPVYSRYGTSVSFENYSKAYQTLLPGKTYAWQVVARDGMNFAAPTEIWTFSVASDTTKTVVDSETYIILQDSDRGYGITTVTGDMLNFKLYHVSSDLTTQATITSSKGRTVDRVKVKLVYGDNYFSLQMNHKFERNETYFIKLNDQANHSYQASFRIK